MTAEELAILIKRVYLTIETDSITLKISADGEIYFAFETPFKL